MTRNFAYDPEIAFWHFPRLNRKYGPYTYVWPNSAQATLIGADLSVPVLPDGFLGPPEAVLGTTTLVRRLAEVTS